MMILKFVLRNVVVGCCFMLCLLACKQEQAGLLQESLEIFKVEGDESSKRPTELTYKEVKFYDANHYMTQQHFYAVDNTMKGFEVVKRDGKTGVSNYYAMDSTILAIYNIQYDDNANEISRMGYDGQSKEHLRTELYAYDATGNKVQKEIRTKDGELSRMFTFTYDTNGNQIGLLLKNSEDKVLREEKFKIVKSDENNRWLEKWGYINDQPSSFHRRVLN